MKLGNKGKIKQTEAKSDRKWQSQACNNKIRQAEARPGRNRQNQAGIGNIRQE